jgi:adenosine deaminase
MSQNILVCTLGASWAVIPEVYGFLAPARLPLGGGHFPVRGDRFLAPARLPLYRHHPGAARLDDLRASRGLVAPDEIWVCTTEGQRTQEGVAALRQWSARLSPPAPLRVWQAAGTDQLADQEECLHMRELILRTVLLAHERAAGGQVTLSLAGGRKTMSADMQLAGDRFGCRALIHVVGKEPLPDELRNPAPASLAAPLSADACPSVQPLIAGAGRRSELLDIDPDGAGPVTSARFPLPLAALDGACAWPALNAEEGLARELEKRERESGQLLGNYLRALSEGERHENWRGLYRLPPRLIERLRRERLAALLLEASEAQLQRHLFGDTEPRVALKTRHPQGFAAYERPGELSGSALLVHPAAVAPYARAVVRQAVAENLAYVELRGSPGKYGGDFLGLFHAALQAACAELDSGRKPEFRA